MESAAAEGPSTGRGFDAGADSVLYSHSTEEVVAQGIYQS